jgi:hypothetical protein
MVQPRRGSSFQPSAFLVLGKARCALNELRPTKDAAIKGDGISIKPYIFVIITRSRCDSLIPCSNRTPANADEAAFQQKLSFVADVFISLRVYLLHVYN